MSKRHVPNSKVGCSSSKKTLCGIHSTKHRNKKKLLFGDRVTGIHCSRDNKDESEIGNFSSSSNGNEVGTMSDLLPNITTTKLESDEKSMIGTRCDSGENDLNVSQFRDLDAEKNEKIAWSDSSSGEGMVSEDETEDEIEEPFKTQDIKPKKMNITIKQYCSDEDGIKSTHDDYGDETPPIKVAQFSQFSIENPSFYPVDSVNMKSKEENVNNTAEDVEEFEEAEDDGNNDVSMLNVPEKPEKKYKKIVKGGLVERLTKLRKREQSDLVFWKYNKTDRDFSTAIYTRVKGVRVKFSVVSVVCELIEDIELFVMLPVHMFNDMNIEEESKIRIFPPWNKMFLKEMNCISLLCAYRIEVLPQTAQLINTPAKEDLLAFQYKESGIDIQQLNNLDDKDVALVDIKDDENVSLTRHHKREEPSTNIPQAVEQNGYTKEITFIARIQRVYYRCVKLSTKDSPLQHLSSQQVSSQDENDERECSFVLLVQDDVGCLGEIKLARSDEATHEQWTSFLCYCEGKIFSFSKLKLKKEISTNKNGSLQSMARLFDNHRHKQFHINRLFRFDYLGNSGENIDLDFFEKLNESFGVKYKPSSFLSRDMPMTLSRVNVDMKLITVNYKNDVTSHANTMQHCECRFYGNSLAITSSKVIVVKIYEDCHLPEVLLKDIQKAEIDGSINVRIKDVRIQDNADDIIADSYSAVYLLRPNGAPYNDGLFVNNSSSVLLASPAIQPFNVNAQIGDLVSLHGRICGVDEESALFWNVCKMCTSEDVTENNAGNYFCSKCSSITKCKMKVQLSVFLFMDSFPDAWLLCKLLETTISFLLPTPVISDTSNFNGYDMKGILSKRLYLPICIVDNITRKNKRQKTDLYVIKELKSLCKLL